MKRRSVPWSPLRRYVPLAGLMAVQLLIILVVPSVAPGGTPLAVSADGPTSGSPEYVDPTVGAGADTGDAGSARPSGSSAGPNATGATETTTGDGGGGAGAGAASGDTSHCVNGRQFDPEAFSFAPPCVPTFAGDNGGATARGVTGDKITIVRYDAQSDPAVDALLESVNLGSSDDQEDAFREAAEQFINERYELYGRELEIIDFKGACDLLPPQYDCLREDMRTIVSDHQPFYVFWRTTLASAAFDELSRLGVPNAGGQHFSENFSSARRPYHYDQMMTGTNIAEYFSKYWCKRLAPYPVKHGAGLHPTSGQGPMNGSDRVLGIIIQDDPVNTEVLNEIKERVAGCGGGVKAVYQYAQDIDRAQEQRKAAVAKMREAGVTFITYLGDAIAPYFVIITEDEDRYWPENFVAGTGYMDHDYVGRLYDVSTTWNRAWGISTLPVLESLGTNDAADVWKATGRSGNPPFTEALADWTYYRMIAEGLHLAGPNLTPETFEQGSFRTSRPSSQPTQPGLSFGPSNHGWIDDVKEVYYSKTATSQVDGRPGAYVAMNGGARSTLGSVPDTEFTRPGASG